VTGAHLNGRATNLPFPIALNYFLSDAIQLLALNNTNAKPEVAHHTLRKATSITLKTKQIFNTDSLCQDRFNNKNYIVLIPKLLLL